ncbi:hypothetical protein C8R43DRAFT_1237908 [Mycena crocata]|nr:hypothetical protein C8R43DRAFT_1237908 [Mycena crocata]
MLIVTTGVRCVDVLLPESGCTSDTYTAFLASYTPVAIFVGETSELGYRAGNGRGIGATHRAHCPRIPKPTAAGSEHEFVDCDITLMSNVSDSALMRVSNILMPLLMPFSY